MGLPRADKSAPTAGRFNLLKFIIGDVHDKSVTCPPDRVPTLSRGISEYTVKKGYL